MDAAKNATQKTGKRKRIKLDLAVVIYRSTFDVVFECSVYAELFHGGKLLRKSLPVHFTSAK